MYRTLTLMTKNRKLNREVHGMSHTPEWNTWKTMKARCHNPDNTDYPEYGGRGIFVCEEWRDSFITFYRDMGDRPSPKHSLDRIDNSKGYSPDNCRWTTWNIQNRNRKSNVMITCNGKTQCLKDWAIETNQNYDKLRSRKNRGWPHHHIVFGRP